MITDKDILTVVKIWITNKFKKKDDKDNSLYVRRYSAGDANYKPTKDIFEVIEFGDGSSNIPDKHWYYIFTTKGNDNKENYEAQLALGMTTEQLYYRAKIEDFKDWHKIAFDETPSVKETQLYTNNPDSGIRAFGKNGSVETDITDIFLKADISKEGIKFGVCSNRMGYVVGQNFKLDCTRLTDSELQTLQSFPTLLIRKSNDSPNYPTLAPSSIDIQKYVEIQNKTGYLKELTKVIMRCTSSNIEIQYPLPLSFRNDDNSKNNLYFYTGSWVTMFGVDIKKRE